MKQLNIILTFLIFSICNAQNQEKLITYLKSNFPQPDTLSVGKTFYDDKYYNETNIPIQYKDIAFSKYFPEFKIYNFSLLFQGCYTLELKKSILLYNKQTEKFIVQTNPYYANFEFNKDFIDLIKSYRTNNNSKLDKYFTCISSLLLSTDSSKIIKTNASENLNVFYDSISKHSLIFESDKHQIKNIKFKY